MSCPHNCVAGNGLAMNRTDAKPVALALTAAILWGLWWVPIRYLNTLGLEGAWAGLAMSAATAVCLIPVVAFGSGFSRMPGTALVGGLLIGFAITAYATALAYTDVVRVVLLFYLAPAWSTIIECVFMGRRWNWRSLVALGCSFFGMFLILGGDLALSGIGFGDLLALLAGIAWSAGAAAVFAGPKIGPGQMALLSVLGACVVGLAAVVFVPAPDMAVLASAMPATLLSGGLYMMPTLIITLWSARLLAPALLSFLLSAEIISGVGSSAIFLDEEFGLVEMSGSVFIALGAITEVLIAGRSKGTKQTM